MLFAAAASRADDDPVDEEGPFDRYIQSNLRSRSTALPPLLVLSLSTLADLGPTSPHSILPFVNYVVSAYLGHWDVGVRGEAVETCCRLLGWQLGSHATRRGGRTGRVIEGVLLKLLRTAVSDPSPDVRHTLVLSLDYRYDPHLCQAHHLSTLFLLVQDEVFAIRACALKLLGRLAVMNPAYVLPALRGVLMRLVLELQCNGDTSVRESATRTLIVFLRARALQRLVRPFLTSLVDVLPVNEGVAPRLAAASLEALGELALVVRGGMKLWLPELIPHIIKTMQDQSSVSKQQTSLRTLGQIVGATGYVITPYLKYPDLMPIAVAVLPGTKNAPWNLRCEVLRTFGILGALDPQKFTSIQESVASTKGNLSSLSRQDRGNKVRISGRR